MKIYLKEEVEREFLRKIVIYRKVRETVGKGYIEVLIKEPSGNIASKFVSLDNEVLDWIADTVAEMYYPNESPKGIAEAFK